MSIKELFKNTFIYGISFTLSRFFVIFLVPVYTRVLPKEEFGALEIILAGMNISALVLGLQIQSGTARMFYEARDAGEAKDLVSTSFWAQWIVPILGTGIFILYSSDITHMLKIPDKIQWIVLAALIIPFSIQYEHNLLIFRLKNVPLKFLLFNTGKVLLSTILIIFFIFILHLGVTSVFLGELISFVLFFWLTTFSLREFIGMRFSRKYLVEVLKYGIPLGPAVWSNWLQNSANRFLILSSLGLSQVAIYGLAFRISNLLMLVQYSFRLAWTPKSIEIIGKPESERYYVRVCNLFMAVIGSLLVFFAAFAEVFLIVFAPSEYYKAVRYIGFIGTGIVLSGIVMFFALGNNIVKKTYYNTIGFLIGSAINLGGLYLTIHRFGLTSVAIWYVVGAIVVSILILLTSQRNYKIPYSYFKFIFWVAALLLVSIWRFLQGFTIPDIKTIALRLVIALVVNVILILILSPEVKRIKEFFNKSTN